MTKPEYSVAYRGQEEYLHAWFTGVSSNGVDVVQTTVAFNRDRERWSCNCTESGNLYMVFAEEICRHVDAVIRNITTNAGVWETDPVLMENAWGLINARSGENLRVSFIEGLTNSNHYYVEDLQKKLKDARVMFNKKDGVYTCFRCSFEIKNDCPHVQAVRRMVERKAPNEPLPEKEPASESFAEAREFIELTKDYVYGGIANKLVMDEVFANSIAKGEPRFVPVFNTDVSATSAAANTEWKVVRYRTISPTELPTELPPATPPAPEPPAPEKPKSRFSEIDL